MVTRTLLFGLALVAGPLAAQDSVRVPAKPIIRAWEAGVFAGAIAGAAALDQTVRNAAQAHRSKTRDRIASIGNHFGDKWMLGALAVSTLAGAATGVDRWKDVSWHALESAGIATGVAFLVKTLVGRQRPDASPTDPFKFKMFSLKDNSFPSGHTTVAFAVATSFASDTKGTWNDVIFYSASTLTALSRINDDRHWLSDTVAGAGNGIMSARLVQRWHRPYVPAGTLRVGLSMQF